jgi:hypothetical protein
MERRIVTQQEFFALINLVWDTEDFDAMLAVADRLMAVVIDDLEFDSDNPNSRTVGDHVRHLFKTSANARAEHRKFTRRAADSTTTPLYLARAQALDHALRRMAEHYSTGLQPAPEELKAALQRVVAKSEAGTW